MVCACGALTDSQYPALDKQIPGVFMALEVRGWFLSTRLKALLKVSLLPAFLCIALGSCGLLVGRILTIF